MLLHFGITSAVSSRTWPWVGYDGEVCGVNDQHNVSRWDPSSSSSSSSSSGWDKRRGKLKQISVGNREHIWGVNAHDKIYKWNGTDHRWMQKTPNSSLRPISVGSDGEVWGINKEGCVYRWDKKKGTLRQILVGSAAYIWGVNAEDNVYHWDTRQNAWTQMPGKLKHISVGSDGEVWGNERIKIIGPRPWVRMLSFSKQLRKWFDRVYYRVW